MKKSSFGVRELAPALGDASLLAAEMDIRNTFFVLRPAAAFFACGFPRALSL